MLPAVSELAEIGEVRAVEMSTAQRVMIDRAAHALETLGMTRAHGRAARELREVSRAWREARYVDEVSNQEDP